jgi:quercetin dioxygenase-like cupin family protein
MTVRSQKDLKTFATEDGEHIQEIFGADAGKISSDHFFNFINTGGTINNSMARITIIPGGKTAKHYHPVVEESYYFLSGTFKQHELINVVGNGRMIISKCLM